LRAASTDKLSPANVATPLAKVVVLIKWSIVGSWPKLDSACSVPSLFVST